MDLLEKAARFGIETSFTDGNGQRRDIDRHALEAVLAAFNGSSSSEAVNDPVVLCSSDPISLNDVVIRLSLSDDWTLSNDHGFKATSKLAQDLTVSPGVYRLNPNGQPNASVIVAPERAYAGNFDRLGLLAVQLYALRSERNWGIGDFSDLQTLLRWSSAAGLAGVGLNPLHALFDDEPDDCSPYSPSSRLFLNSIYIDVTKLPELPPSFVSDQSELIEQLRRADLVDYAAVGDLKQRALRTAFREFNIRTTLKRRTSFDQYRKSRGELLSRYACFEVLRKKYSGAWWDWPDPWKTPDEAALLQLRQGDDVSDIEFVEFVQWCADQQLGECARLGKELGLPVGLYLDVAVGVKAGGFDAWNEQDAISHSLSIGAPPDQLNTAGQDWGLAGYNASGLERRLFAPFREMLAASMRYAGAIRLDHVLGLNRLYVVPQGASPAQGVYIKMPFTAMLALVAIESMHHRCVVIGEDLGTVPDGFRDKMADAGVWSYRVMMFERADGGQFKAVGDYPANALVTFNTHDLPTFAGWRSAHDISVKHALQIDPGESHDDRHHAVGLLAHALKDSGHDETTFHNVVRHLADTPSRLLGIAVEDLMGVVDQINVPGTMTEHPNWRRRLPFPLEQWDSHIDVAHLRQALGPRLIRT
jgi:4-alpha-glucanotransferase